jgi:hypothetical protein
MRFFLDDMVSSSFLMLSASEALFVDWEVITTADQREALR